MQIITYSRQLGNGNETEFIFEKIRSGSVCLDFLLSVTDLLTYRISGINGLQTFGLDSSNDLNNDSLLGGDFSIKLSDYIQTSIALDKYKPEMFTLKSTVKIYVKNDSGGTVDIAGFIAFEER